MNPYERLLARCGSLPAASIALVRSRGCPLSAPAVHSAAMEIVTRTAWLDLQPTPAEAAAWLRGAR